MLPHLFTLADTAPGLPATSPFSLLADCEVQNLLKLPELGPALAGTCPLRLPVECRLPILLPLVLLFSLQLLLSLAEAVLLRARASRFGLLMDSWSVFAPLFVLASR